MVFLNLNQHIWIQPLLDSSNSSFSKCMTNHYSSLSFLHYEDNSELSHECIDSDTQKCFLSKHFAATPTPGSDEIYNGVLLSPPSYPSITTFSFISCSWNSCKSESGGAIYMMSRSSASLFIKDSLFRSCVCSSGYGGAVHAEQFSQLHISFSVFSYCTSQTNDGGAVQSSYVSQCFFITGSRFVSNNAVRYSGAIGFGEVKTSGCSTVPAPIISDCMFCDNSAVIGGSLHMRPCYPTCYVTNSLLYQTISSSKGILHFNPDNEISSANSGSFSFLFFHCSASDRMSDIYLESSNVFNQNSFINCFSTSTSTRIHNGNDHWIPQ